jgi:Xaa-Pro aminopeptidase
MSMRSTLVLALLVIGARLSAQVPESEYAARRAAFAARLPDSAVAIVLGAREPRADYLTFVQTPHFWYLTGFLEADAALLLVKRGAHTSATLFVLPRDPEREAWTGARIGAAAAAARTGMAARVISTFRPALDSAIAGARTLYAVADLDASATLSYDDQFVASIRRTHPTLQVVDANGYVDSLRSRKSAAEFALMRRAIGITVDAENAAFRTIAPGVNEGEVQAVIEFTFRKAGSERPGFSSIVGSGVNATSLHYNANDQPMRAGDLVVMDIGASFQGYTADVTRTAPVSGTFSAAQRDLYQVVRDAQAAAERQAVPRARGGVMEDSANAALSAGLARLGLIESVDAVYDAPVGACRRMTKAGCSQFSLYYNHGLGHGIGLEVHDPDPWDYAPYQLLPGAAFTIEPGLYIRGNALDILPDTPRNRKMIAKLRPAFEKYRDLGVRIEDDYIVTESGVEWLSRAPREIAEIEAAMKR